MVFQKNHNQSSSIKKISEKAYSKSGLFKKNYLFAKLCSQSRAGLFVEKTFGIFGKKLFGDSVKKFDPKYPQQQRRENKIWNSAKKYTYKG